MMRSLLYGTVLLAALHALALVSCGHAVARLPIPEVPKEEPTAVANPVVVTSALPKSAEEWRSQKQALLDQIDANNRENASLAQQIDAADQRAKRAEQDAQQATARTQAAWGRRIAFLCFALSVVVTIVSFTPWGAIIPKWAGPAGIAAGGAILVASSVWVWMAEHVMYFSIAAIVIGAAVALLAIFRGTLLLRIRNAYAKAVESAASDADELNAKADSLESELDAGVHGLGQKMRGKAVKTWDDVARLREEAATRGRL